MKVVKRNEDDSQGEIFFSKQGSDSMPSEGQCECSTTGCMKITLRVDQRVDDAPQCLIQQDSTRREIIANLTTQVLQSSNRANFGQQSQVGQTSQPMSEETKDIIVEQGKIEALEQVRRVKGRVRPSGFRVQGLVFFFFFFSFDFFFLFDLNRCTISCNIFLKKKTFFFELTREVLLGGLFFSLFDFPFFTAFLFICFFLFFFEVLHIRTGQR